LQKEFTLGDHRIYLTRLWIFYLTRLEFCNILIFNKASTRTFGCGTGTRKKIVQNGVLDKQKYTMAFILLKSQEIIFLLGMRNLKRKFWLKVKKTNLNAEFDKEIFDDLNKELKWRIDRSKDSTLKEDTFLVLSMILTKWCKIKVFLLGINRYTRCIWELWLLSWQSPSLHWCHDRLYQPWLLTGQTWYKAVFQKFFNSCTI